MGYALELKEFIMDDTLQTNRKGVQEQMNIQDLIVDETKIKDAYTHQDVILGKPHDFMRVHPNKEYRVFPVALREYEGRTYLVMADVAEQLRRDQFHLAGLVCIYHQNKFMLWNIPLGWSHKDQSAFMAKMTDAAITSWVRVTDTNQVLPLQSQQYDKTRSAVVAVPSDRPSPDWTRCQSMESMVASAFHNKVIDSVNHFALQR
jgi:hypothetical protein